MFKQSTLLYSPSFPPPMQLIPLVRAGVQASAVRSSGAIQWFSRTRPPARPPSRLSGVILRHVLKAPSLPPSRAPALRRVPSKGHSLRAAGKKCATRDKNSASGQLLVLCLLIRSIRADHYCTNIFAKCEVSLCPLPFMQNVLLA